MSGHKIRCLKMHDVHSLASHRLLCSDSWHGLNYILELQTKKQFVALGPGYSNPGPRCWGYTARCGDTTATQLHRQHLGAIVRRSPEALCCIV
jgi:hypothetical protein